VTKPKDAAPLPPMMAIAIEELKRALADPPVDLSGQWPFKDPQWLIDQRAGKRPAGRPSAIAPHQVVRLVRFVKLGHSVAKAAARAGLKERTARRILAGQAAIAHHPAVEAAGVWLPRPGEIAAKSSNAPTSPAGERPATPLAKTAPRAPTARISNPPQRPAEPEPVGEAAE
jgi:hypothetical protein